MKILHVFESISHRMNNSAWRETKMFIENPEIRYKFSVLIVKIVTNHGNSLYQQNTIVHSENVFC
jgi:hypothetical protein